MIKMPPMDAKQALARNLSTYVLLHHLETTLREFIRSELNRLYGDPEPQVGRYKRKVKGVDVDIVSEAGQRKAAEVAEKISGVRDLSLMYYLDFSDLGRIISSEWSNGKLDQHFGRSGEAVREKVKVSLRSLEGIRNRLAHNRIIADDDFHEVQATCSYFDKHLQAHRPKHYADQDEHRWQLIDSLVEALDTIETHLQQKIPISQVDLQHAHKIEALVSRQDQEQVRDLCKLLEGYYAIPNTQGARSKYGSFVSANSLLASVERVRTLLIASKVIK